MVGVIVGLLQHPPPAPGLLSPQFGGVCPGDRRGQWPGLGLYLFSGTPF